MADDLRKRRTRQRFEKLQRKQQLEVFLGLQTAAALQGDSGWTRDDDGNEYLVEDFRGFVFEGSRID